MLIVCRRTPYADKTSSHMHDDTDIPFQMNERKMPDEIVGRLTLRRVAPMWVPVRRRFPTINERVYIDANPRVWSRKFMIA